MKKLFNLTAILLLLVWNANAQDTINPYNAEKTIQKGIEMHDAGEYQKAIDIYNSVNRNDSNYMWAIGEKSLSLLALKKYEEVVQVCEYAKSLHSPMPIIYINLGNALDEMGKKEDALKAFDDGIKIFPMNCSLHFNKAITLQRLDRIEEAVAYYQKALWLNPKHRTSHLRLGYLCASEGKYTQAMFSLISYLLLNPSDTTNLEVLSYLDKFVSQANPATPKNIKLSDGDNFSDLDMIIANHLALNSKYKLKVDMDYSVVRQAQALLENLKYDADDNGFWMQFYAPFFTEIFKKGDWEGFVYDLLISSSNEKIVKVLKKNISKIKNFNKWVAEAWENDHNFIYRDNHGKKEKIGAERTKYTVESIGNADAANNRTGTWEFYSRDGNLTSTGAYKNGLQQDKWVYYYVGGQKSGDLNFMKGNPDGIYNEYNKDGVLIRQTTYRDSAKNGNTIDYFVSGDTLSVTPLKNDQHHGMFRSYYPVKSREFEINYVNGKIEGKAFKYYDNGIAELEIDFKDGKKDGMYKQFHKTGKLYNTTPYLIGKSEGPVKYYFNNGNLQSEGQCKGDNYVKDYKTYYDNGKLQDHYIYDEKGKLTNTHKHFDLDGKLHYEIDYTNDKPVAVRYYNKNGGIIYQNKTSKNILTVKGYTPNGRLEREGIFENGQKQGTWKYYDIHGNLDRTENYDKGTLSGEYVDYFKSGKVDKKYYYTDGKVNGPYLEYHTNGAVYLSGYYKDGNLAGEWNCYRSDSSLSHRDYYLDGDRHGWQQEFDLDGHISEENFLKNDKWSKMIEYNNLGKAYETIELKNGTGAYVTHYANGQVCLKGNYINGSLHGKLNRFSPRGKLISEGEYFNNKLNGLWKWYNEDSQLATEGYYFYGEKDSVWKTYYPDKQLKSINYFDNGKLTGISQDFYKNNQLSSKGQYLNDKREGAFQYFNDKGELMYVLYYYRDDLLGYSYPKSGKLADTILLDKGNAKIVTYYESGNKSMECEYKKGLLQGKKTTYYSNGKIFTETGYINGLMNGTLKTFYADGTPKSEESYYWGYLHGVCTYYHANGKVSKLLNYKLDQLQGPAKYYDQTGKLLKERRFLNNDVVDEKAY